MGDPHPSIDVLADVGHPDPVPVSPVGFIVAGVHASGDTLGYFIGGESLPYLVRWSVNTIEKTATYGGPEDVRIHPYGCSSMHATGVVAAARASS